MGYYCVEERHSGSWRWCDGRCDKDDAIAQAKWYADMFPNKSIRVIEMDDDEIVYRTGPS